MSARDRRADDDGRTFAQWFCLIGGLAALLFGLLGFLVNGTFENASWGFDFNDEDLNGDLFLGVEVNGWTNVVNIAAGVLLLLGFASRALAKTMAIAIGIVYAVIAILGWIDGNDVFDFMVTNTVGNVVYSLFALTALIAGLVSSGTREDEDRAYRERAGAENDARLSPDDPRFGREEEIREAPRPARTDAPHRRR